MMTDYIFYAVVIAILPMGALFAAYVVTRENNRALARDRRLPSDHS